MYRRFAPRMILFPAFTILVLTAWLLAATYYKGLQIAKVAKRVPTQKVVGYIKPAPGEPVNTIPDSEFIEAKKL